MLNLFKKMLNKEEVTIKEYSKENMQNLCCFVLKKGALKLLHQKIGYIFKKNINNEQLHFY